jgi:hypothetical protein
MHRPQIRGLVGFFGLFSPGQPFLGFFLRIAFFAASSKSSAIFRRSGLGPGLQFRLSVIFFPAKNLPVFIFFLAYYRLGCYISKRPII